MTTPSPKTQTEIEPNNSTVAINTTPGQMKQPMMGMQPMMMPMNGMGGMTPMGPMGPMGGMGYMPGMMGYGPQNFMYCEDPMKDLAISTGAIIRQQIEMFEAYSGCETQNRYQVFIQSPMGLKYAFQCNERSGCCGRCCGCSTDCRSLEIVVRHVSSPAEIDADISKIFLRANKPCTLGCCCCRPYMDVKLAEENKYLGKVREPFTCCDKDAEIYDENGHLKYTISGDCCQFGLCCGSSAEKLAEIEFKITQNNEIVGMMKKMNASLGEYFTKADSYKISFPNKATPEEKMLFIIAGLLIDYQNFENNETPQNNRKQQGY